MPVMDAARGCAGTGRACLTQEAWESSKGFAVGWGAAGPAEWERTGSEARTPGRELLKYMPSFCHHAPWVEGRVGTAGPGCTDGVKAGTCGPACLSIIAVPEDRGGRDGGWLCSPSGVKMVAVVPRWVARCWEGRRKDVVRSWLLVGRIAG